MKKDDIKHQAEENKAELLAILQEMESTDVEYKIRLAIIRLRALVDKLHG